MTNVEQLNKQEEWDNWYYTRLQDSVNKVISYIHEEENDDTNQYCI
jgi:hypothetical protein